MADLLRRRRARPDRGLHEGRVRRRDHVLRHRQRLRHAAPPRRRGARSSGLPARQLRPGDEGLLPDVRATDRGLSAAQIHKQIDASLERLQTEYVDLYQCHRFDAEMPIEETMAALTEVVDVGQGALRSASASGRRSRSRPAWRSPTRRSSSPRSRSTRCCGARRRPRCSALCAEQRDLAGRVVAARRGRADRQVQAGRAAAADSRAASDDDEHVHRPAADRRHARRGRRARADRRRGAG